MQNKFCSNLHAVMCTASLYRPVFRLGRASGRNTVPGEHFAYRQSKVNTLPIYTDCSPVDTLPTYTVPHARTLCQHTVPRWTLCQHTVPHGHFANRQFPVSTCIQTVPRLTLSGQTVHQLTENSLLSKIAVNVCFSHDFVP